MKNMPLFDPALSFLGIYPTEKKIKQQQTPVCKHMRTKTCTAFFVVAKILVTAA